MATIGTFAGLGLGTTIDFGSNTYCIQEANGPTSEVGEVETTNSCSTAKEFIASILDNGEVSMQINFDPDQPVLIDSTVGSMVINFPPKPAQTTGATFTMDAFIKTAPIAIKIDDRMIQDVTFRITGAIAITAGS